MSFTIKDMTIRDEYNRQRIFKGVNICFKGRENQHEIYEFFDKFENDKSFRDEQYDMLTSNGVNLIRLGFTWAMLEPKKNQFDEKIISYLKLFVDECQKRNIYIVLDLHQDLFYSNGKYGDGAPKWITRDYKEKQPLAIWAEGYFYMQDVQRAFNDFWRNKNGMQDEFITMWKRLDDEFKGFDNVLAYDYFNEPMINDNSNKIFCLLINNALKQGLNVDFDAQKYFGAKFERLGFFRMALAVLFKIKTVGRLKLLLKNLDDYNVFDKVIDGAQKYVKEFDEKYYQPFINKITSQCSCKNGFDFFEHSYYSNLGIPFSIESPDNSIYSPHVYDLFIDSPLYNKYSSNERVRYIFDNVRKNQLNMNAPVVMGEWGGLCPKKTDWFSHIDFVYSLIEQNQWSSIYWNYYFENDEFVRLMNRPYPIAVCGDIISYRTDSNERKFFMEYKVSDDYVLAETQIYVPNKGVQKFKSNYGINKIEISY